MSNLGYFLGGTVTGVAGLAIVCLLHDHFSCRSSGTSTLELDDNDDGEIVDNSCATDTSGFFTGDSQTGSEEKQAAESAPA